MKYNESPKVTFSKKKDQETKDTGISEWKGMGKI